MACRIDDQQEPRGRDDGERGDEDVPPEQHVDEEGHRQGRTDERHGVAGDPEPVVAERAGRIISAAAAFDAGPVVEDRGSAHGRSYIRTTFAGSGEKPAVEHWLIQDTGHAWCGGDPKGSFADGLGPNASAEMVRFFLASRGG